MAESGVPGPICTGLGDARSCTECDVTEVFSVVGDSPVQPGRLLAFPHYRKSFVTSHSAQLLASLAGLPRRETFSINYVLEIEKRVGEDADRHYAVPMPGIPSAFLIGDKRVGEGVSGFICFHEISNFTFQVSNFKF